MPDPPKPQTTKASQTVVTKASTTTQGTSNSSWNIFMIGTPGSLFGINADIVETAGNVGKELVPKAILNTTKPSNIGTGTWSTYIEGEAATAASKFGSVAKVAKSAGYVAVGIDIGVDIYDNIQAGAPTKKIVSDAAVDTAFGVGGLAASTGTGALVGSVVPGAGTIVGGAVGFGVGVIYMVVTEIWQPDGKSIKDRAKEGIYNTIK